MDTNKIEVLDFYKNKHIVPIDSLDFSVHVYGIAIKDGKVLISPQLDGFDFPGGTAEKGETHIETLIREVKEETGYLVEPVKLLNIYTSFFQHTKSKKNYQSYLVFYLVNVIGGEISDEGFDDFEKEYAKMAKWVSIKDLRNMKHICTIDVKDELLEMALDKMNPNSK